MTDNTILEAYLKAKRITMTKNRVMNPMYTFSFEFIKKYLDGLNIQSEFHLVFSSSRQCEALRLNKKNYVVYDQYLGQSINLLNRIYFKEHEYKHSSLIYSHKIAAEYLRRVNIFEEATFCALFYSENKENIISKTPPNPERLQFTLLQEFHIIAHETFHLIANQRRDIYDHFIGGVELYFQTREKRKHLQGSDYDIYEQSKRLDHLAVESWDKYKEENKRYLKSNFKQTLETTIKTSQNLRLEMACDAFASSLIALRLVDYLNIPVLEALKAIYVGHHHLRMFKQIELALKYYANNRRHSLLDKKRRIEIQDEIDSSVEHIELVIRSQHMLHHCIELYKHSLKGTKPEKELKSQDFHASICDFFLTEQNKCYDLFLDPATRFLGNTINGGIWTEIKHRSQNADNNIYAELLNTQTENLEAKYGDLIDQLTGWKI